MIRRINIEDNLKPGKMTKGKVYFRFEFLTLEGREFKLCAKGSGCKMGWNAVSVHPVDVFTASTPFWRFCADSGVPSDQHYVIMPILSKERHL